MKGFNQNIARYIDQLKIAADPVRRNMFLRLLAEEEAKQTKAQLDPDRLRAFVTVTETHRDDQEFFATAWLGDNR